MYQKDLACLHPHVRTRSLYSEEVLRIPHFFQFMSTWPANHLGNLGVILQRIAAVQKSRLVQASRMRWISVERGTLQVTELWWAMLMPLFHLYPTGFKYGRVVLKFYLVNLQVGYGSEAQECCRRRHYPRWDHSHLMRYFVTVNNHHTEIPVEEWTIETTSSLEAMLLVHVKSPVRITQSKLIRIISSKLS